MDLPWLFYIFFLLPAIAYFLFYRNITIRRFAVPVEAHDTVPFEITYVLDSVFREDVVLQVRMIAPNGAVDDAVTEVESSILNVLEPGTVVSVKKSLTALAENGNGPRTVIAEIKVRDFVQNYASAPVVVTVTP